MNIYFIAHGSITIGMGHVMRSLSLAEAFRERGHNIIFFSKYKLGIHKIEEQGFKVEYIPDQTEKIKTGELQQDAEYVSGKIAEKVDVILVDSYDVNEIFFNILRRKTKKLIYIDDLNAFYYPVDILVNGSASAFNMGYEKMQSAQLLLGITYNLLRKEFVNIPARFVKPIVEDILITTGNSDPSHMTEWLLKILKEEENFKDIKIHVIKGGGFEPGVLTDYILTNTENVILYDRPASMMEIMTKCDLAITAGGSTLYELAACGVPAIVFAYADNQVPQIEAMKKEGLLSYVGFYTNIDRKALIKHVQYMCLYYEERSNLTKRLQELVDARGALRIVKEVEKALG